MLAKLENRIILILIKVTKISKLELSRVQSLPCLHAMIVYHEHRSLTPNNAIKTHPAAYSIALDAIHH
jgi:hypothetical protein